MRRSLIAIAVVTGLSIVLAASGYALASARGDDGVAALVVDSPGFQQDQEPVVAEVLKESPVTQAADQVAVTIAFSSAKKGAHEKGAYDGEYKDGAFCTFKNGGEF